MWCVAFGNDRSQDTPNALLLTANSRGGTRIAYRVRTKVTNATLSDTSSGEVSTVRVSLVSYEHG